jgi:hypothetical protein
MDLDISTNFTDWIETNLLEVQASKIERIYLDNYSINERTLSIEPGETIDLRFDDEVWTTRSLSRNSDLDTAKVRAMARALGELEIVGVRPKPAGLSSSLKAGGAVEMTQSDRFSLQNKGFYIARQDGRLLSNEGDLKAYTTDGVVYTLRFGEVLYGSGMAVTAGLSAEEETDQEHQKANRYLFITADFDEDYFREPPQPESMAFQDKADSAWTDFDKDCKERFDRHQEWERNVERSRDLAGSLNQRFADWYYVISEDSFKKIHLSKAELTKSEG